ncbi:MAG: chemotaxis protein CheA [Oscillospiraceae bacterium]|nr:chemotaxis protein CheA [Oscillospiraceae bacterium]
MSENTANDSLVDMFIYETSQNTEQLEQIILNTEAAGSFAEKSINEIFRIMHTIKGSAAMMSYVNISTTAHRVEDLFYYIRENPGAKYNCSDISDLILSCMDYINKEIDRIRSGSESQENDCALLVDRIEKTLNATKNGAITEEIETKTESALVINKYKAVIFFEQGCEMENIRAYSIILALNEFTDKVTYEPADIIDNDETAKQIRTNGFIIHIETEKTYDELFAILKQTTFLRDMELTDENKPAPADNEQKQIQNVDPIVKVEKSDVKSEKDEDNDKSAKDYHQQPQSIISVGVSKLDKLMDLMGEIVIAEAMVVENPDLAGCELTNFRKAAVHLRKILLEMQDMVMSLRLVPLATTFQKMHRIVRDMSKKLGKDVRLQLIGEDTDVDKNIIEHISDPLIHLVRNSIDHGIESMEDRIKAGKQPYGTVTLEAQNAGSDVLIFVSDDGRGLDKEKILSKARKNDLIHKLETELTEKDIYNMIYLPGFSTNESVTEYSGRGVGMDVVMQNITSVGGSVSVDSVEGKGMTVMLKIPLTVAIIDGMNIGVGNARFTIPITAIRESFKPLKKNIFKDTSGNEFIMVRGECLAIMRLHSQWDIETKVTELDDGILIIIEQDDRKRCIFADALIGRQQVVVKTLPQYLKGIKNLECLSGCTLLGDGSISQILDTRWLVNADINTKEIEI